MSLDANKKTATDLLLGLANGRIATELLADDAVWWLPGRGDMPIKDFLKGFEGFSAQLAPGGRILIHGVVAEADRVAIEAESIFPLKNGKTYNNTYHFLVRLKDGKAVEVKEYNNTAYARDVFSS